MIDQRKVSLVGLGDASGISRIDDSLALDEPICIFVNGEYHATLIATPTMKEELAIGYLFTEGVISSKADVKALKIMEDRIAVDLVREVDLREASTGIMNLIVTACGSGTRLADSLRIPRIESDLRVDAGRVAEMCAELNRRSVVHRETGGTHAAMLCSVDGVVQAFAEDVGRHNAVDKVIGSMVLQGNNTGGCMLVTTGRLSGEMVQKAGRAGISVVASMTVPLVSGIRLAEATGQTLVSLWRGRLKVYVNENRVSMHQTCMKQKAVTGRR
jgi:FdhD protein